MHHCPRCGTRLIDRRNYCPSCSELVGESSNPAGEVAAEGWQPEAPSRSTSVESSENPDGTVVARFQNAAEAGYFAHELRRSAEFPVSVALIESFDATTGCWSTRFELTVPDAHAEPAARLLDRLVKQSDVEEPTVADGDVPVSLPDDQPTARSDEDDAVSNRINWVPIVLTLTAGSAAIWGARQLQAPPPVREQPAREFQPDAELWSHLSRSSAPWQQRIADGNGVREIRIDDERELATIREDADGHFESEFTIKLGTVDR